MVDVGNIRPSQPPRPLGKRDERRPPPERQPEESGDEPEDDEPPLIDEYA